jgi:hypothetical protein
MAIFLPWLESEQREGERPSGGRPVREGRRWSWPRRRPGDGAKWRGDRGDLIPVLTLGWGCSGRRLRGAVWAAAEANGGGAIGGGGGAREGCGGSTARCGAARDYWPLFIGAGKAVTPAGFEL